MEEKFKNPITMDEIQTAINRMKLKNSAGVDGTWTEEIKSFGLVTKLWIFAIFNDCIEKERVPNIWLKSRV